MDDELFEQLVQQGVAAIPERFLKKLNNVSIIVEAEPSALQKQKVNLRSDQLLFGLYEGVPQNMRGINYSAVLPDKITIFKNSILMVAKSAEAIKELVKDTVWHEIAHHFGLDEKRVRQAESKRRTNK